jgi:hypothetical protein
VEGREKVRPVVERLAWAMPGIKKWGTPWNWGTPKNNLTIEEGEHKESKKRIL